MLLSGLALQLCSTAWGQVDADRLRGTPFDPEPEPERLLLLQPNVPTAIDSVCEVIGDLPTRDVVGRIVDLEGEVFVERLGQRRSRERGDVIMDDDHIITNDDSYVLIRFNDAALMSLSANSHIHLYAYWYERSPVVPADDDCAAIELFSGGLRIITGDIARRNFARYEILAHNGAHIEHIAPRTRQGTDLEVRVSDLGDPVLASVFDGGLTVRSAINSLDLGSNMSFSFAEISSAGIIRGLTSYPGPGVKISPQP